MNQAHRAAISLNNTGVALLHRGCYRQGITTLSDAVAVMNTVVRRKHQEDESPWEIALFQLQIQTMIDDAAKRFANPELAGHCYDIRILSDYQSLSVVRQLSSSLVNGERVFLMRMEALDAKEDTLELESAIILLNFGLAYRCLLFLADDISTRYQVLVSAMRLLHLAYSIVLTSCQVHAGDETELRRVVLTSLLILLNLVQLSTCLGLHQDGLVYSNRLSTLLQSAEDLQKDELFPEDFAAGAA